MIPFTDPKFTVSTNANKDISIDLNDGFDLIEFCIMAKTIGGQTLGIPIQVENCGNEILSLHKGDNLKIKRLYSYDESDEGLYGYKKIDFYQEQFSFSSNKPTCPIT